MMELWIVVSVAVLIFLEYLNFLYYPAKIAYEAIHFGEMYGRTRNYFYINEI